MVAFRLFWWGDLQTRVFDGICCATHSPKWNHTSRYRFEELCALLRRFARSNRFRLVQNGKWLVAKVLTSRLNSCIRKNYRFHSVQMLFHFRDCKGEFFMRHMLFSWKETGSSPTSQILTHISTLANPKCTFSDLYVLCHLKYMDLFLNYFWNFWSSKCTIVFARNSKSTVCQTFFMDVRSCGNVYKESKYVLHD